MHVKTMEHPVFNCQAAVCVSVANVPKPYVRIFEDNFEPMSKSSYLQ